MAELMAQRAKELEEHGQFMQGSDDPQNASAADMYLRAADRIRAQDPKDWDYKPGHMYAVDLKINPEHMLDWDKPFADQSPYVQDILRNLNVPDAPHVMGEQAYRHIVGNTLLERETLQKMFRDRAASGDTRPFDVDRARLTELQNPEAAGSAALRDAGIPGIRYLDQSSRGAGAGTSNYVVFDPSTIDLVKKYGLPAMITGGATTSLYGLGGDNQQR
jgi:hypothetical protein